MPATDTTPVQPPASASNQTPPPPAPEAPPAPTAEEVAAQQAHEDGLAKALSPLLAKAMFTGKKQPEEAPSKADDAAKGDQAQDAAKADPDKEKADAEKSDDAGSHKAEPTTEPAKTEPKKVKVSKKEPVESAEDVISRAAEKIADSVTQRMEAIQKPEPPQDSTPTTPTVPDEYKDDYEAMQYLAKSDPKYAERAKQLVDFAQKEEDYIANWEQANAGRSFDPTDNEHDDFYAKNQVKYNKGEVQRAKIAVQADRIVASRMKERDAELDELKASQALVELTPKIGAQRVANMQAVMGSVNKDYAEQVATAEGFQKLQEADPLVADVVMEEVARVAVLSDEVIKLADGGGKIKPDGANPVHAELFRMADDLEAKIQALPAKDRTDEAGRKFTTRAEFVKMTPAQQKVHWFVGKNELISAINIGSAQRAQARIQAEQAKLKRYAKYMKADPEKKEDTVQTTAKPGETTPPPAPAAAKKSPSPSSSEGAKVDTVKPGTPAKSLETKDLFGKAMFGR